MEGWESDLVRRKVRVIVFFLEEIEGEYNGEGRELEALFQVCKRKKNFSRSPPCTSVLVPFSVVPVPLWYCNNFPASVLVPFSVVPVPLWYCHFLSPSVPVPISLVLVPLLQKLYLLNCILNSLGTFTLTLEPSLLKVIKNPKV